MPSQLPIDDIIKWSDQKLTLWQRDALRRLARAGSLSSNDQTELLAMVKEKVGLFTAAKPPTPIAFAKADFSGPVAGGALKLTAVRGVKNVNRLMPWARIEFAPEGMTVIYGRNGSGKSGFVRILRTACRSRIDNPTKLKVLSDVYGESSGPQQAEIVVESNGEDAVIPWKPNGGQSDQLLQVAVFDSAAASLYVDNGQQIRFLPFGLMLPHQLNELCLTLKTKLEEERRAVKQALGFTTVSFQVARATKAQSFYRALSGRMGDAMIEAAATFAAADHEHLSALKQQLEADQESGADLLSLANWCDVLAGNSATLTAELSDETLDAIHKLAQDAREKREAASLDAIALFGDEPLPGVGAGTWRALWRAARDYSLAESYLDQVFPVVAADGGSARCVLCQQPIGKEAALRFERFRAFMDGSLSAAADQAEAVVSDTIEKLPRIEHMDGVDWAKRVEQLAVRDSALADQVRAFRTVANARRKQALELLSVEAVEREGTEPIVSPSTNLTSLAKTLAADAEARARAGDDDVRAQMESEHSELVDQKILSENVSNLKARRDLLKQDTAYQDAIKEVQTEAITKAANKFVDEHLTSKVIERFNAERKILEIDHLRVGLSRKSGQTKATFQTDSGTTFTKNVSEILSEGEQRALSLSVFLTEIAMTEGSGPIVLDDPVSSLDRERSIKVAERLANEARARQVIVFTHDLIFFNDLCGAAEAKNVSITPYALFANKVEAGKLDPAGVTWKGLAVKKRLERIETAFLTTKALYVTSPADYEFGLKGLYGRLRDTYERIVEECIFNQVVTRGADRVETLKLRYVHLSDLLAERFHSGMTRANTYSHDNPASETVSVPEPSQFEDDFADLEALVSDLEAESKATESRRPTMKPKK